MKCSCFPARDATGREIHTPSCESRMTAEAELADRKRELVAVINERNELRAELAKLLSAISCRGVDECHLEDAYINARKLLRQDVLSSPSPQQKGA